MFTSRRRPTRPHRMISPGHSHAVAARTALVGGAALLALMGALSASASADQILSIFSDSLTTYQPTAKTGVQDVRPRAWQRLAYPDGSARAGSHMGQMIHGHPGSDAGWNARSRGPGGIRLHEGTVTIEDVDLALPARGMSGVVIGRTYNARQEYSAAHSDSNGYQGYNWMQTAQPAIVTFTHGSDSTKDMVYMVLGADRYAEFKRSGGGSDVYRGVNGAAGVVHFEAGAANEPDTYTHYDLNGTRTVFFGFDGDAGSAAGQFWKKVDPAGNAMYAGHATTGSTAISSGYSSGRITNLFDGEGREYVFTYTTGRLTKVEVQISSTPTGYQVEYGYFSSTVADQGLDGDLRWVKITTPLTDSGKNDIRTKHYRYYTGAYHVSSNPGYEHGLKYIMNFEGYRALDLLPDSTFDDDPLTYSYGNTWNAYADAFFEYDSTHRIRTAWFNGECGCGGGSNGTYAFEYESNGSYSDDAGYGQEWCTRVTVDRPDSAFEVTYFDDVGQPLSHVVADGNPDSGPPNFWSSVVARNGDGQLTSIRTPADIDTTDYDHGAATFDAASQSGLVRHFTRWSSGDGDFGGFIKAFQHAQGTGTAQYDARTAYTTQTMTVGGYTFSKALVSGTRRYHTEGSSEGSNYDETTHGYTFWSSAGVLMPKVVTTTHPVVTTGNNGSNAATVTKRYLRADGTTALTESATNRFNYAKYSGGQLVMSIQDVDTNDTGDIDVGNDDPNGVYGITENGDGYHRKTTYAYDGQGRLTTTTRSGYPVTFNYYTALLDRRLVTMAFPKYVAGTPQFWGPASYSVTNHAGRSEASATIAYSGGYTTTALTGLIDETTADAKAAVLVGTVYRMSTSHFNGSGTRLAEQRAYHLLSSFPGSVGTNYDATKFGYDTAGRRLWTRDATGTITTTLYDSISRYSGTEVGTNDYVNTESWRFSQAATNNMTKVAEVVYDGSGDSGGIGNGHVTRRKAFLDSDSPALHRNTDILYDYRGRAIVTLPAAAPYTLMKFDNLGRALAVAQYGSSSGIDASDNPLTLDTNRMALAETTYDQLGRAFKSTRHAIDPTDGSDDDTLVSENWYNADGLLIKTVGEMVMKYEYDRLNRPVVAATMAKLNDSAYADADDCAGDIVAQENWTFYESTDCDTVLMSAAFERFHIDLANGTTGHLNTETSLTGDVLDKSKVLGRIQIHCTWYDDLHRPTTSASYGTAGIDGVGGGSNFDRSGTSEPTDSSGSILRSKTVYNDNGTVRERSDVHNRETRMLYDDAGRVTCEIANYTGAGTPIGTADRDTDIYTRHIYTNGLRIQMYSDINGDGDNESGGDPTTEWDYGVTKAGVVGIASEQLLSAMTFPDGSGSDKITYTYSAQGEQLSMEDQAETKHTYTYDGAGRRTSDAAVTIAGGLDTDVERIEWAYDGLGRVSTITQFDDDAAGDETDQVEYTYGIWGTVTQFEQDHDDVVTPASSGYYSVSYTYEKETSTRRTIRRATMTLPDGGTVTYEYLNTGNKLDDDLSRVSDVKVSTTVVADYFYNGVATPVRIDYAEPGVYATYAGGSAGSYSGWDTFNRPIVSKWTKDLGTDRDFYYAKVTWGTTSTTAGLVKAIEDEVHAGFDVLYTYDALDRLTQAQDGTWNGSSITCETRQQDWGLDQFGNFLDFTFDFDGNNNLTGASDIDDSNVFDAAQKITSRTSNKAGGGTVNTAHTVPGAVTDDARTFDTVVYDAWNRLISVQGRGSGKITAIYRYNGLGHRITWHDDANASGLPPDGSDPVYHLVYTEDWRMLAVYRGTDSDPKERHVPHFAGLNGFGNASPGGIDGTILRDKDASTAWAAAADGLDERRYICQNWRGDVVALLSDAGLLVESTRYTAYGEPISLPAGDADSDADWDSTDSAAIIGYGGAYDARYDVNLDGVIDADDAGDALNLAGGGYLTTHGYGLVSRLSAGRAGYAGYEHDRVMPAFLTHVRHRVYRMDLGRWMQPDPLGYVDGVNRWGYVKQAPAKNKDPLGLWSPWEDPTDPGLPPWLPTDWPKWPWRLPCGPTNCPGGGGGGGTPSPIDGPGYIPGTGWQIGLAGGGGMCWPIGATAMCLCISIEVTTSYGECCCQGLEGLRCCRYTLVEICVIGKVGLCGLTQPSRPRFFEPGGGAGYQRNIRANCGEVQRGCTGEVRLFGQAGPFRIEWNPLTPNVPPQIIIPLSPLDWLKLEGGVMGCSKCYTNVSGSCACTTEW